MAKGNMLQGQATGKVGDIVFMVRNGQQVARVYTSAGGRSGDQASIAVRRQRVRFGAASNQYLLYRNIVRGMYRSGKSTKQSDYNFFVRENVDLLPYLTREENAAGVKCAMPGTFSRGTLGSLVQNLTYLAPDDDDHTFEISTPGQAVLTSIAWTESVGNLKDALKGAFPNARKVSYAVIDITRQELDLPSGSQFSHVFTRGDVTFDLFEENPDAPDSTTIREYFAAFAPASLGLGLFATATGDIVDGNKMFQIAASSAIPQGLMENLYVVVFASNDQVGDCYTTTLASMTVPESDGGLSLYDTLRTDNHRQVAEDSYGYATGVMRTNIQQA